MPAAVSPHAVGRRRAEAIIRLLAPALDLLLTAGEQVSRRLGGDDDRPPVAPLPPPERRAISGAHRTGS